jgi:hypothetical protein
VRIGATAARRLRVGAIVRATVRAGGLRHSKRMRVVRAVRASGSHTSALQGSNAAVGSKLAESSASADCTNWYETNRVGLAAAWATSTWWWELHCVYNGFYGSHLALWYDFYFFNWNTRMHEYYGTWTRYDQDGRWVFWYAPWGIHYGPYY